MNLCFSEVCVSLDLILINVQSFLHFRTVVHDKKKVGTIALLGVLAFRTPGDEEFHFILSFTSWKTSLKVKVNERPVLYLFPTSVRWTGSRGCCIFQLKTFYVHPLVAFVNVALDCSAQRRESSYTCNHIRYWWMTVFNAVTHEGREITHTWLTFASLYNTEIP